MSISTAVKQRASAAPIGCFLTILVLYSASLVGAMFFVFGSNPPGLAAVPYAWAPVLAAGVTVWLRDESLRDWLGQLRRLRPGGRWYLAGIGFVMIGTEFRTLVAVVSGTSIDIPAAPVGSYVVSFGLTLFLAGALEELGWRGFLQPRLQQQYGALMTSVGVAVVWILWHVPMIVAGLGGFTVFWEYAVNLVAISIVFGWLYNNTNGALPVVMLAHASHNMPPIGAPVDSVSPVFDVVSGDTIFYVACALLVTLYAGSQTLTRDGTLPGIPGRLDEYMPQPGSSTDT